MRVFIAGFGTETNMFVPFPTGRRAYEAFGIFRGDATKHPPSSFSGPLHVWRRDAEARGWAVVEGLLTFAAPSGTTVRRVYEDFRDEILESIRAAGPFDIVLLNLHGAMVADGYDDCEGDLLTRVRALVGPKVAIGAELDLHCHLSAAMLSAATAIVIYKEYPHIDPMERAAELFAICADAAEGKTRPVMVRHDCRMMGSFRTPVEPMKSFVARMASLEGKDGILSVSLAHGFAFADVEDVGARMLVVADGDAAKAGRLAAQLAGELFAERHNYATRFLTPAEALDRAGTHNEGTVVIADRADNPGSGAPGDATFLLRAILERRAGPTLFGVMWDPMAFRIAEEAGEGATLDMRLGGKSGKCSGDPVDLRVTVRKIARDVMQPYGPVMAPLGDVAWLSSPEIDIAINTHRTQTFHADAFRALGIDPTAYRIVVVKSAQHFYNGFAPIARETLYCTTPGASEPAYARLPYTKRTTPFWPKVEDPFA
ncbi:MAG: M81 family metallopeptidase [Rhodospirillales bacterium]|nr:MAG: M81 family metallopeptidase [Rhodospirillales bacterium]